MTLEYLFRVKKYGKWEKGKVEVSDDLDKSEYRDVVEKEIIRKSYSTSTNIQRIEIQYIKTSK